MKKFILAVISFSFLTIANAETDCSFSQEVYVADRPLPQIASELINLSPEAKTYCERLIQ